MGSEIKLTVEQRAAVENRGGSLLVSAAAGSGKTKVLVDRLFQYVTEEYKNLDEFLVITYTKAAAAELRGKIASELSKRVAESPNDKHLRAQMLKVWQADIRTVDSFCTALLRENTHLLLSQETESRSLTADFRVLDENEAALIRERVLKRTLEKFYENLTPAREQLADTLGAGQDDRRLVKLVLEIYEKLQSHAWPSRWLEQSRETWKNLAGESENPDGINNNNNNFDGTIYAKELLIVIKRKAKYIKDLLYQNAKRVESEPDIYKAYGLKFLEAASYIEKILDCVSWEEMRTAVKNVIFPRLSPVKNRKDDRLILNLKQVWKRCKEIYGDICKLRGPNGAEAMEDLKAAAPAMDALLELVGLFTEDYQTEKTRLDSADFSDQEHLALKILIDETGNPTALGEQISGRYTEILVDEYQDTNEIQNAIFYAVSRQGGNLFTVGDVKQSIYRFRLADPLIFLEKYARFVNYQDARDGQERKILLSKNFRSRREILDAANYIFSAILSIEMGEMNYGPEESLYFGAEYYPERQDCGIEFHLIDAERKSSLSDTSDTSEATDTAETPRGDAEARFAARRVRELLDAGFPVTDAAAKDGFRPCRPEDIVVLMRSPRSRIALWAATFAEENIPCSFDESGGFFRTMEISTVLAFLQTIDNPRQDVPLISVLRSPIFAFSPDQLAEIRSYRKDGDFYDAVKAAADMTESEAKNPENDAVKISDETAEACAKFLNILNHLREAAPDLSVYLLLWKIYNEFNILGIFGATDGGVERRENLLLLSRYAEKFEQGGYKGLFAFITQIRRLIDSGRAPDGQSGGGTGVKLMSIHKSKGLEFPIVILADLNHAFSRQDFNAAVLVHPMMGLGPRFVDLKRRIQYPTMARLAIEERLKRENLSEEQRVLYVGMTRPKEKLILIDSVYNAEKYLQRLAASTGYPVPPETVAEGKSFGDWILMALLARPEAENLRQLARIELSPDMMYQYQMNDRPWKIDLHDAKNINYDIKINHSHTDANPDAENMENTSEDQRNLDLDLDLNLLNWQYDYQRETEIPAKVTATQLKGRILDDEISENAGVLPVGENAGNAGKVTEIENAGKAGKITEIENGEELPENAAAYARPLKQPKFLWKSHGLTPAERGTATHLILQYLDFSDLNFNFNLEERTRELVLRKLLTPEQAEGADVKAIARFLKSPLADEIRKAKNIWREYPFMILMDAPEYDKNLKSQSEDKILLQGVVDCCFETDNGLVIVDFKTDHVYGRGQIQERARKYQAQLYAYSRALERVLEKPVIRRVLYFLSPGAAVEI